MRQFLACLIICVMVLGLGACGTTVVLDQSKILNHPEISYAHFSVDDCNGIFEDLTNHQYTSIFDQPDLQFLKSLHDDYGIVVSLYVFYSWDADQDKFDLSKATDRYQAEFSDHADWLKIGFHAADANAYQELSAEETLYYYNSTIREIIRITGNTKCIDRFVRLDRYTADLDGLLLMNQAEYGIEGLFIADQNSSDYRISYALTQEQCLQCDADDWYVDSHGISYTATDVRLESIETDDMFYGLLNDLHAEEQLIVFTHEWAMREENVKRYMELLASYIYEYRIPSAFCTG